MSSTVWNRFVRTGAMLAVAALTLASDATARPVPGRPRVLNLFSSSGLLLQANRCVIDRCTVVGVPCGEVAI